MLNASVRGKVMTEVKCYEDCQCLTSKLARILASYNATIAKSKGS